MEPIKLTNNFMTSQVWTGLKDMNVDLKRIVESNSIDSNFMNVLHQSIGSRESRKSSHSKFIYFLRVNKLLLKYNEDDNHFDDWTMDEIKFAHDTIKSLNDIKIRPPIPLINRSNSNQSIDFNSPGRIYRKPPPQPPPKPKPKPIPKVGQEDKLRELNSVVMTPTSGSSSMSNGKVVAAVSTPPEMRDTDNDVDLIDLSPVAPNSDPSTSQPEAKLLSGEVELPDFTPTPPSSPFGTFSTSNFGTGIRDDNNATSMSNVPLEDTFTGIKRGLGVLLPPEMQTFGPKVDKVTPSVVKPRRKSVPKDTDKVVFHDHWVPILGSSMPRISYNSFLKVRQPETSIPEMAAILSFIIQKVKTGGAFHLNAEKLHTLIATDLSRLDALVALFSTSDSLLKSELITSIAAFNISLPLIMPDISHPPTHKSVSTFPMLQSIVVMRSKGKNVIENRLFRHPYRLMVAVRHGTNTELEQHPKGKSTILNQLFKTEFMFTSNQEPGAGTRRPYSIEGAVELTWLTVENCKEVLWDILKPIADTKENEILLLANLHGNAIQYSDVVAYLQRLSCSFLIFQMAQDPVVNDKAVGIQSLLHMIEGNAKSGIKVNMENQGPAGQLHVNTQNLTHHDQRKIVCNGIHNCFYLSPIVKSTPTFDGIEGNVSITNPLVTPESIRFMKLITDSSLVEWKSKLLLQTTTTIDQNIYQHISIDECYKSFMRLFFDVLKLPLNRAQIALAHIDQELEIISSDLSTDARSAVTSLKKLQQSIYKGQATPKENELRNSISAQLEEVERCNLGLEHIFRETGRIYEASLHKQDAFNLMAQQSVGNVANLVLQGQVIEIMDGDISAISTEWLSALLNCIVNIRPNFKIFVVSILGLQSSGKSTLLNNLFGCKFSVSAGRCTRGLFLRILHLSCELKMSTGVDALFIIDTEGLCGYHHMVDENWAKRDKLMAAFAMSISQLTILNVKGEMLGGELADILQIVLVTLARLEQGAFKRAPDLLLVQHVPLVDEDKLEECSNQLFDKIQEAVEVTEKQFVELQIRNTAFLEKLVEGIQRQEVLKLFNPYKSGATANASPSEEYHKDVGDLHGTIIKYMEASSPREFRKWSHVIIKCWKDVSAKVKSLGFNTIDEIKAFVDRSERISDVKEAINDAISSHRADLVRIIVEEIGKLEFEKVINMESLKTKIEGQLSLKLTETITICRGIETGIHCKCKDAQFCIQTLMDRYKGTDWEATMQHTVESNIKELRGNALYDLMEQYFLDSYNSKFAKENGQLHLQEIIQQHSKQKDFYSTLRGRERESKIMELMDSLKATLAEDSSRKKLGKLETHREALIQEAVQVYGVGLITRENILTCSPEMYKGISLLGKSKSIKQLEEKRGFFAKAKSKVFAAFKSKKPEILSDKDLEWLNKQLKMIPQKFWSNNNDDDERFFQPSSCVRTIKKETDSILEKLTETLQFEVDFKWQIHLQAVATFVDFVEAKYHARNHQHGVDMFSANAHIYRKVIERNLFQSVEYAEVGVIIADHLLMELTRQACTLAEQYRRKQLLSQSWISNPRTVRICFYEEIQQHMDQKNFDDALAFFHNPKEEITDWFTQKVDKFGIDLARDKAAELLKSYLATVSRDSETISSWEAFTQFMKVCELESILELFSGYNPDNNDTRVMMESMRVALKQKVQHSLDSIVFKRSSQHRKVLRRLGCTECCPRCGALCWGHFSHKKTEETKLHLTVHQPQGLAGECDSKTGKLILATCTSNSTNIFGFIPEERRQEFYDAGWQLEDDYHLDRNEIRNQKKVMEWCFIQLHSQIAIIHDVLPCEKSIIDNCSLAHLNSKNNASLSSLENKLFRQ